MTGRVRSIPLVVLLLLIAGCARAPQRILDPQGQLARWSWWDNRDWDWYAEHIPFFESPDTAIDATYYYRWEVVTKHLTYGSPAAGYTFTEFLDRPFWSGAYGAISCPLGHQAYEVRWLKDPRVIEDFARYWFETPGAEPRSYSNWYGDAMWATYLVRADTGLLRTVLPYMERQVAGWEAEHYDSVHAMFHWSGMHDGMETNIDSRQTADPFAGGDGYRPTLNAYLYADLRAVARAAGVLGDSATARAYAARAAALKGRVQQELWDPAREFFFQQFVHDEQSGIKAKTLTYQTGPYAGNPHGREEIGFVPWQFGLPDAGYEHAWRFLMDPDYFFAPFGPTTTERHDPQFFVSPTCCVWSGNEWPYATTQTLVALANLLNDYDQQIVTGQDYLRLLRTYALDQRWNGRPYVAEAADPETGSWAGHNSFYHSEHYFHSGFVDLVITGLVGLRPRADDSLVVHPLVPDDWPYFALDGVAYHGHTVAIVWDVDGTRYKRGTGLMLFVDGRKLGSSAELERLAVALPPARPAAPARQLRNFAVSNDGAFFPHVSASYSAPTTPPFYATDGNYWYHVSPPNRWTTLGSPNTRDTLTVDFGVARPLEALKLYLLDDGGELRAPAEYQVEGWIGGEWEPVANQRRHPEEPTGHRANTVSFTPIATSRVRVLLEHRPGAASGLTEIEAWGSADLPLSPATAPVTNLALGAAVSASFESRTDDLQHVHDGRIAFTRYTANRWTTRGSPHTRDWIALDFGHAQRVAQVDLYLWGDSAGVRAPARWWIEYRDGGRWRAARVAARAPAEPETWARNVVTLLPVETTALRIVLERARPAASGVTEIAVWGEGGS
jgi:hypothetical protein